MNLSRDQASEGVKEFVEMLDSKQLRANAHKSKCVIVGPCKSRTCYLKNAENNPIIMGANKLGFPEAERYLGDQISYKEASASYIQCYVSHKDIQDTSLKIKQKKLRPIGKVMAIQDDNLSK